MSKSHSTPQTTDPTIPFRIRDDPLEALADRASLTTRPTDIVIAPVQLHQRTLQRRLATAGHPITAFQFTEQTAVATRILETADRPTDSLDRVDRMDILEDVLAAEGKARELFGHIIGADPAEDVNEVEQTRTALVAITNYHPVRVHAYREVASTTSAVTADATDTLYGTLAVEGGLRKRTTKSPADDELLRRAIRELRDTDGAVWETAYPDIKYIHVVGLSSITAPLLDLLTAIGRTTSVTCTIYGRQVTGSQLRTRLPQTVVADPGKVYIT